MEYILGLIHLVLIIWAVLSIIKSGATGTGKVIWALFVIIFPIIGFVAWFLAGPKG
ncbi:PLDc N-terminal domain-containing protein [Paracoccaceae bacterium GXU_MW_L88]